MIQSRLVVAFLLLCFGVVAWGQVVDQPIYDSSVGQLKQNVKVVNATLINTPALEFSPQFYQNGLVFVSSRKKDGPVDELSGETYYEIFYSEVDGFGMPLRPELFSSVINSQLHEGPVAFDQSGQYIFFTRNNSVNGIEKPNEDDQVVLKIYQANRGEYDWENIKELPFNSDNYSCLHPTVAPDGKRIFFASDMPNQGGQGGFDIYFIEKRDGRWSQPINLGPEINTSKNELFPFIHASGVLFFSSNGHLGAGGLDIFMIDIGKKKWSKVKNLGSPFNSASDDLGIILNTDGTRGYFSSDRAGGIGKDDIYMFEAPEGINGMTQPEEIVLDVTAKDGKSGDVLKGAAFRLFVATDDGLLDGEERYDIHLVPDGNDPNKLVPVRKLKPEEELGTPIGFSDQEGKMSLTLDPTKSYVILVSKPGYTTAEVNYDTEEKSSEEKIEVVLDPSPCLRLKGIANSEKFFRAIPDAMITIINICDSTRQVLRTNLNGNFDACLDRGCDYEIMAEKDGFEAERLLISTSRLQDRNTAKVEMLLNPLNDSVIKEPIKKGTVILLENIYYDFNKWIIRKGAERDLEVIVQLMEKYPSMEIELAAHTDSRGDEEYNLSLSLKRAESAKKFLIRRGINSSRVSVFGYGESKLRNKCTDNVPCSEEEHQYNRRTEVKVTRMEESVSIDRNPDGSLRFKERN